MEPRVRGQRYEPRKEASSIEADIRREHNKRWVALLLFPLVGAAKQGQLLLLAAVAQQALGRCAISQ